MELFPVAHKAYRYRQEKTLERYSTKSDLTFRTGFTMVRRGQTLLS
jgi:hypothetical protein